MEYESLFNALKREVFEETGLRLTCINSYTDISNSDLFSVECLTPFCVYQTLEGPVDSIGMVFLYQAEGEPLKFGDESCDAAYINWERLDEMYSDFFSDRPCFS